jgi:hypothetical protein
MDFKFLMIWVGDSSNAQYKQCLFFLQESYRNDATILVLPVPAVPEIRTLLPSKTPLFYYC